MAKFKGIIITDNILTENEMALFLKKYNSENYDSVIDSRNPDGHFDYFIIGDMFEKDYITTNNDNKVSGEIIKNINFEKSINSITNNLECIVDKYHWYSINYLKECNPGTNDNKLIKNLLYSIDKDKVLTIVTFHF